MQFKSGTVLRFLSGFCALFTVAVAAVLWRQRGKRRGRGRRQKERRRRLAGKRPNMELYQRIEKPKEETRINDNEIRITSQGRMSNYITYATTLLTEKSSNEVVLKAMGRAINKTVMIAELIKGRIIGLHQITCIGSTDITDSWEPLEQDLPLIETTRHVSMITITLSKKELNPFSSGYQPPIPADQVKQMNDFDDGEDLPYVRAKGRGGDGLGGGRGGGNINGAEDCIGGGRGYGGRGRGHRRSRIFRVRGRGSGQVPAEYDNGEAEASLAQGRVAAIVVTWRPPLKSPWSSKAPSSTGGRAQGRGRIRAGRPAHAAAA